MTRMRLSLALALGLGFSACTAPAENTGAGTLSAQTDNGSPMDPAHSQECGTFVTGQAITASHPLVSCNGLLYAGIDDDGNLVTAKNGFALYWSNRTPGGDRATVDADGDFSVYGAAKTEALWGTATFDSPGSVVILRDNGNLDVTLGGTDSAHVIWSTVAFAY